MLYNLYTYGVAIAELIVQLSSKENLREALEYVTEEWEAAPLCKELHGSACILGYSDYYIQFGKLMYDARIGVTLEDAAAMHLSCAPQIIACVPMQNQIDCVLIVQILGSEGEEGTRYRRVCDDVSDIARKLILQDFDIMAEEGIYNPAMVNTTGNWYVIPKTGRIYVSIWSEFAIFKNEEEKRQMRKDLISMLGLDHEENVNDE